MGIIFRTYVDKNSEEAERLGQTPQESWREDREGCLEPQAAGEASVVEVSGLFVWHSATNVTLFCSLATGFLPLLSGSFLSFAPA